MMRKRGENEKSHVEQLQNQFLFQIKQTIYLILVQNCGQESQSTRAILKQIGHESYIHLEFPFCAFLRHPRSLTFQNLQLLSYMSMSPYAWPQ